MTDLRPLPLPRCDEVLRKPYFTSPSFRVSDNRSLGQTSYTMHANVNIAGLSLEEQTRWWAASAQAFLEDLIELTHGPQTRFVLLFDTFEKAKPETQTWIADHVLRMATPSRVSHLVVVVAGKQVPDPTGEWERYSYMLPLQPLQLDHWLEYAALIKSSLTREQIQQCYVKHAANPLKMAEIIDAFS